MNWYEPAMVQPSNREKAAKFKKLYEEYEQAVTAAGTMLRAYGMDSKQFRDADQAACLLWVELQKMRA